MGAGYGTTRTEGTGDGGRLASVSATNLLAVWERAAARPPGARSAALLALADAADNPSAGDRDRALAATYRRLFGPHAVARADCPRCGEAVECDLDLAAVEATAAMSVEPILAVADCAVEWRSPTATDLAHVAALRDPGHACEELLRRCVVAVLRVGEPVLRADWPAGVALAVGDAIDRADPLTAAEVELACPACGCGWTLGCDVGVFLWAELDRTARRLMAEVHYLATAYGWAEADILTMTATRRAAYRALAGG